MGLFSDGTNKVDFKNGVKVLELVGLGENIHPEYGQGVKWEMEMYEEEGDSLVPVMDGDRVYKFSVLTGTSFKKDTKPYKYAEAFLGREPKSADEIEVALNQSETLRCRAYVGKNEKGYPKLVDVGL
jgi:hypothetical protein